MHFYSTVIEIKINITNAFTNNILDKKLTIKKIFKLSLK